jgi:hypothetical protein
MDRESHVDMAAETILRFKPDILLIGGWSRGYQRLVQVLSTRKTFPILSVYHSTVFHGRFFGDDIYLPQVEQSYHAKHVDYMGFVDPRTALYYQQVKKIPAIFVPHKFELASAVNPPSPNQQFRIGVLGGVDAWYKNAFGAAVIARDFAANHPGVSIVAPPGYDKPRHTFLEDVLGKCHVLIHISHLECYSNTIQEAWARGIPVIFGPSADGLTRSQLVDDVDRAGLEQLRVESPIDAVSLYELLNVVYNDWAVQSKLVHTIYARLAAKTETYNRELAARLVRNFRSQG